MKTPERYQPLVRPGRSRLCRRPWRVDHRGPSAQSRLSHSGRRLVAPPASSRAGVLSGLKTESSLDSGLKTESSLDSGQKTESSLDSGQKTESSLDSGLKMAQDPGRDQKMARDSGRPQETEWDSVLEEDQKVLPLHPPRSICCTDTARRVIAGKGRMDILPGEDEHCQSHRLRSNSVESSCVSMKSDRSMELPVKFEGRDTSVDLRQRSKSPESSCVSMKSDRSMELPVKFKGRDTSADLSQRHRLRSNSVESSCVSMKSDWSMEPPVKFEGRDTSTDLRQRSESQKSSCVFLKVRSMEEPVKFEGRETSTDQSNDSQMVQSTLKSNLKKKFQYLHEGTAKQGNPTLLNEIYTELYITESESGEINIEHEVRQIETQSRIAETEDTPINCSDIFTPLPGQDKPIRTVLTKGVAGIGKTVSVQKFIVDWAEGKENQDVQLIFPLPFRELNLMKDKTLSLSDLLHFFLPETKEMKPLSSEYKILFIFDGLDECRLFLDFQSNVRLCDVTESASVDVLLTNLIAGNLLPSALIWITSRPAAAELIPTECIHRVTEVRGFNDPEKEEYFRKRISDQSLAHRIISHLKSSRSLFIMCHIPVFCWISATVLEKMLRKSWKEKLPKTLTQMYTHFLIIQTTIKHEKDYKKKVKDKDMIVKLGKLAFQQLVKGNLIFYEEDLRECGIDVTDASVYSGLCTQIFIEELGLYQGKVFCFVHLTIQEHLAALYVHLSFTNNTINVFETEQTEKSQLSKVLKRKEKKNKPISELHQRAVDEALQSNNGHLDLFLRFLLGLSVESNQTLLRKLLTQTGNCSYNKEETLKFIKEKIRLNQSPERSINLFHCLNELGDVSLEQEIQDYLKSKKIKQTKLNSSQWSALVYVLLTSEQMMDVFVLKKFTGPENAADEVLQKMLPVVKESRSAQMYDCGVTDKGCAVVASALRSNPSHLRELDQSKNTLGDSGVNQLADGLKDPHCKLEILRLVNCGVTDKGCPALASALRSNPSHLRELNLSKNKLRDAGVKLLSAALEDPHCKLEKLGLIDCGVTDKGCVALALALRSKPSHLRELDLDENKLGDSGVKLLSDELKDPHCELETLWLINCGVTDEGCDALASALRSNPSHLRHLNLIGNKLGDSDVKLLSDLKDDPHYRLETLMF